MKKIFSLLGIGIFAVALLGTSGCGQINTPRDEKIIEKNFSLYENTEHGIKIEYSNDWDKEEGQYGSVVMFFAPQQGKNKSFTENLNIFAGDTGGLYSQEEYVSLNMEQLREGIGEFDLLIEEDVDIDGNIAHKISYTGLYEQIPLKWMQWFFVKGEKDYVISYTAQEDEYGVFVETVEAMVETLEIK